MIDIIQIHNDSVPFEIKVYTLFVGVEDQQSPEFRKRYKPPINIKRLQSGRYSESVF